MFIYIKILELKNKKNINMHTSLHIMLSTGNEKKILFLSNDN